MPAGRKRLASPGPVKITFGYADTRDPFTSKPLSFNFTSRREISYVSPTKRQRKAATTGRSRPKNRVSRTGTTASSTNDVITTAAATNNAVPPGVGDGVSVMEGGSVTHNEMEEWDCMFQDMAAEYLSDPGGTREQALPEDNGGCVVKMKYEVYTHLVLVGGLGFCPISSGVFVVQGWDRKARKGAVRNLLFKESTYLTCYSAEFLVPFGREIHWNFV
jgi:hypothetical protein